MSDKRNNPRYKLNFGLKIKLFALLGFLVIAVGLLTALGKAITVWYDTHTIKFNKVVEIKLQKPIEIEERKIPEAEVIRIVEQVPVYEELPDIEKYICDKWGVYDCKLALAIFKAEGLKYDESGELIPDLINVNSNFSVDIGVAQVNSVYFKKEGCALKDLVDPYKNIDCAYKIYKASGWNAWSAYKNGSFTNYYE